MWLIDHSEGEGVGGGCAPSHAAYSAETYCQISLWGMLLYLSYFLLKQSAGGGGGGGGELFLGRENSRATPPPPAIKKKFPPPTKKSCMKP